MGLDEELALHLGRAFGGGMGRQALTCGALSGAVMVLGLLGWAQGGQETTLRQESYGKVQELLARFRQLHGSTHCRRLMGLDISTAKGYQRAKEANLFGTRCAGLVRDTAGILDTLL
jgi:C_GCAxxG_C_C family probable redox protein